jgi:succinyl-diaminopimelate desuccinylase
VQSAAGPGRIHGEILWGLGAADMKGTLAVMATVALELERPAHDVTWVFYAREEVARAESGLHEIAAHNSTLLDGDVAILGEPTDGAVEAGCQGTVRLKVTMGGVSAHAARPFMGRNAVARLSPVLDAVVAAAPRSVELDGITFVEQCEPVGVSGGTGGNVIPDEASLVINHRFAPDRSGDEAVAWLRSVIDPYLEEGTDVVEVIDLAAGAAPHLGHPVLAALVEASARPVVAKVGWTDVATFAERGVPAANFGAGDPTLAHHPDERVSAAALAHVAQVLRTVLSD